MPQASRIMANDVQFTWVTATTDLGTTGGSYFCALFPISSPLPSNATTLIAEVTTYSYGSMQVNGTANTSNVVFEFSGLNSTISYELMCAIELGINGVLQIAPIQNET